MNPDTNNITLYQGSDYSAQITLSYQTSGTPFDLTDYIATSWYKPYPSENDTDHVDFVCTITDAAHGILTIKMDAATTTGIIANGRYDILLTSTTATHRIIMGKVTLSPMVTGKTGAL